MQAQQNIKDADDVDKLANAAVSQGKLRSQEDGNKFIFRPAGTSL